MAPVEQVQRNAVCFTVYIDEDEAVFEPVECAREPPALGTGNQAEFGTVACEAREIGLALDGALDAGTGHLESVGSRHGVFHIQQW